MASSFNLLINLISLLLDTLNTPLNNNMLGLELAANLPSRANDLPTIVVSYAKVEEKTIGIGSIIEVRRELTHDIEVIRADRVAGEMIFHIWVRNDDTNAQAKIDEAAGLFGDLLEEHKNELRSHGLLRKGLIFVGPIESSRDAPVWLIQDTQALGRRLVYNFMYEYIVEEKPAEGIIEQVRIDEIWLDGKLLSEKMVMPRE